jgi:deoxyribodipyrimidine photo-lyase
MDDLKKLSQDPRVTVRRAGAPDAEGACVVYWMQRAQRSLDNPALDVAVKAANALRKPVVVFSLLYRFIPTRTCATTAFLPKAFPTSRPYSRRGISDLSYVVIPNTACFSSVRK